MKFIFLISVIVSTYLHAVETILWDCRFKESSSAIDGLEGIKIIKLGKNNLRMVLYPQIKELKVQEWDVKEEPREGPYIGAYIQYDSEGNDWNKLVLVDSPEESSTGIWGIPKIYENQNDSWYEIYEQKLSSECKKYF